MCVYVCNCSLEKNTSTLLPSCYCVKCDQNDTLGVVINDHCYYFTNKVFNPSMFISSPFSSDEISGPLVTSVKRKQMQDYLDIVHILTRRIYKRFGIKYIYLKLKTRGKFIQNFIRLPSFTYDITCPLYDVENNILFDDTNCRETARIYKAYSKNPLHDSNTNIDYMRYNLSDDNELDKHIQEAKRHVYRCLTFTYDTSQSYFEVNSRKTYNMMSNVVFNAVYSKKNWFHDTGKFIIKYDPTKIKLTQSDYFMHIPTYTSYISPSGCAIVDVKKGKIFQQPDCETAIDVLRQIQVSTRVQKLVKILNCDETN